MSSLVHCDGPGCEETRPVETQTRALFERGWLRASEGPGVETFDFHSRECLAAWSAEQTTTTTRAVDGQ